MTHYIIMSSSYSMGKRIALDYVVQEEDEKKLKEVIFKITQECGKDVSVSTHFVQTTSKLWSSVVRKDHFFKEVEVIDDVDEFIALIKKDRKLKGEDVAKYILSKVRCTHLKLEKLVYLCFAEYLCQYNKELYEDKIYAYKYGPVVESVYEKYKVYRGKQIEDDEIIDATGIMEMPARSRILFAEDGVEKIKSIDDTLRKYGNLSAGDLVDITHRTNTPWDLSGRGEYKNKIIENEIILKYHCVENI